MDLDEFSDDGLDELNDSVLQELETRAIQLTQAQFTQANAQSQRQLPSQDAQQQYSDYGWEEEEDDLDTAEVTNDAGVPVGRPVVDKALRQHQQHHEHNPQTSLRSIPPIPNPRWNPTIDPANRSVAPLTTRSRLPSAGPQNQPFAGSQRFQPPTHAFNRPQPSQFACPPLPQARFNPSQPPQSQSGDVLSALQQRVRALEAELNATRGEASIVRAKSTKAQLEHDEQVARLKKVNAEQVAKQERMMEAALAAEKSASTELQFMQRDMREVNDRTRRKDTGGGGGGAATIGLTTPKKTAKTWGFADGFDDMDIVASPSKGHGRGKNAGSVAANVGERTPSKGKRKRPMIDSPVMALETHTGDVVMGEDKPSSSAPTKSPAVIAAPTAPFEFLQLVLDHGCFHQQPPTFDIFSRFFFPSDPTGTSLASMIFEKLPLMGNPHRPMQLLVDFSELVIHLWGRCLEEQFWEPIKYLVSLVSFTLQLHTIYVAPLIVKNLFPTGQSTVYTLAEARLRVPGGNLAANAEYGFMEEHVDTTRVLSLLYTAALACATTPSETENGFEYTALGFWRLPSLEFVLLLLTPKQKSEDIIGMLDLLASSSLPGSIGPVVEDKDPQLVARSIIERVSAKLTEVPRPGTTAAQRRRLRLAALRTMISFARYPFGALQLASHDNALPRLVTCLSTSIDDLYDQPIPQSILAPLPPALASALHLPQSTNNSPSSSSLHRVISQSVLLLHTLLTSPHTANAADIGQKLSLAHGGSQRYLLALGRLAFAEEDLVMEAGVEGEVVEAAHELLEMAVTPDEGEVVSEAFGA